jgi:hypothetical protein
MQGSSEIRKFLFRAVRRKSFITDISYGKSVFETLSLLCKVTRNSQKKKRNNYLDEALHQLANPAE